MLASLFPSSGAFKTTYAADQTVFATRRGRFAMLVLIALAVAAPLLFSDYWLRSIFTPLLIFSLAALGLNILTGYAGQLSLGTGAFMAVGAFAAYNFQLRLGFIGFPIAFILGGITAAIVGVLFGLPALRIKGFYVAVTTLAAQFFLLWIFTHVGWLTNYSTSGVISPPKPSLFGIDMSSAGARYLIALVTVGVLTFVAVNLLRRQTGRQWMAVRDRDIAAAAMGVNVAAAKLTAFAVSSFYVGVAGALWAFVYLGAVEPEAFDINRSFTVLFMVIIGGMGSVLGSYLGAAFIVLLPLVINQTAGALFGGALSTDFVSHFEFMIFGALIIFFLIVEPLGLAQLWRLAKEKMRRWPFPY